MSLKMKQIIKKLIYLASLSLAFLAILSFFNISENISEKIPTTKAEKEYKLISVKPISQV
jgi:hypothetical protein